MARPRKVPAVLVEATIRGNAKLAALPNDAARLGYFYVVLGAAKLSTPTPGQFVSRTQFVEIAGRFARYLDDYIRVGALEVAPRTCARCKKHWSATPPLTGVLVVHDWHEHQYDPRRLDRQREYDDRQRSLVSDGVSDGQSDGVSDANLTGDSRGGARSRSVNVNHEHRKRTAKQGESENPGRARVDGPVEPVKDGADWLGRP